MACFYSAAVAWNCSAVDSPGSDLAVAVGLTHDVAPMVREFLKGKPEIGKLVVVRLAGAASGASVKSGSHAVKLAEEVVTTVRNEPRPSMLHLFITAPNGFTFFLGQHQALLGAATVYEWDFEGTRSKTYSKGLTPTSWLSVTYAPMPLEFGLEGWLP